MAESYLLMRTSPEHRIIRYISMIHTDSLPDENESEETTDDETSEG